MTYSTNHAIEDTVLTIINDGDGSQCGMTYKQRCEAAETGILQYRAAVRSYSRYRHANYESRHLERAEVIEAATILQAYYREHAKELA